MGTYLSNERKRKRRESDDGDNRDTAEGQENLNPKKRNRAKRAKVEEPEDEDVVLARTDNTPGSSNARRSCRMRRANSRESDVAEHVGAASSSMDSAPRRSLQTRRSTTQDPDFVEKAIPVPGCSSEITNPRRSMRLTRTEHENSLEAETAVEVAESSSERQTARRSMTTRRMSKLPESEEKEVVEVAASSSSSTPPLACCGQPERLRFNVPNEQCSFPDAGCRIFPGDRFYLYDYGGKKNKYCKAHYELYNMPVDQKERFFKIQTNQNRNFEDVLTCVKCAEKVHRICTLHVDDSSPLCLRCGKGPRAFKTIRGLSRNEPRSSAFMMKRLNGFLKGTSISIKTFTSSGTSKAENVVPKPLLSNFQGPLNYKKRAIYISQKQDSVDVVFFALYCREYVNTGIYDNENGGNWFVVDYLDSVPYFKGGQKKELYPRILLAYFDFMRSFGILNGFLHADPPVQGDDYVFNIHPSKQVYKSERDLVKWYRQIFKHGKKEGIVRAFRSFGEEMHLRKFESPADIPLFEGSLWSKTAKDVSLKDFENSMKAKYKEHSTDNFFLELEVAKTVEKDDDEVLNESPMMVDRVKFLDLCQRRNWEFGDHRHAKFSSVALAQWLEEEQRK